MISILRPGDGPVDAVEIEVHRVEVAFGGVGEAAGKGIEIADPDRRSRLREHCGCRQA